jgi:hypothetical protein
MDEPHHRHQQQKAVSRRSLNQISKCGRPSIALAAAYTDQAMVIGLTAGSAPWGAQVKIAVNTTNETR